MTRNVLTMENNRNMVNKTTKKILTKEAKKKSKLILKVTLAKKQTKG